MNYITIKIDFFFFSYWKELVTLRDYERWFWNRAYFYQQNAKSTAWSYCLYRQVNRWMWNVFYKHKYTWKKINLSFWSSLWDNLPCLHQSIHFNENIHVAKNTSAIQCESLRNSLWVCALEKASWLELEAPLSQRVHLGQNLGCVSGNTNTRLLFQAIRNKNFLPK